jgi:hypothetical protein
MPRPTSPPVFPVRDLPMTPPAKSKLLSVTRTQDKHEPFNRRIRYPMKAHPLLQTVLLLATFGIPNLIQAQIVTLMATTPASGLTTYSTESVVLAAGDTATIISHFAQRSEIAAAVQIGGVEFTPPVFLSGSPGSNGSGTPSPVPTAGLTIAGPATIRAKAAGADSTSYAGRSAFVTVSIARANSTPSTAPLNTVVIPESAAGIFSVLLESSTDLITWTAANPGSYGGGTAKRFFRVRVVQ